MAAIVSDPVIEILEAVAAQRFPANTNRRLQLLMDRNNNGELTPQELKELAAFAELSENMSLLRAQALKLLGRKPT